MASELLYEFIGILLSVFVNIYSLSGITQKEKLVRFEIFIVVG
jgi:hypothetical protein